MANTPLQQATGISFGSDTLSDYSSGNFSLTLTGTGTTAISGTAYYQKIGKVVSMQLILTVTASAAAAWSATFPRTQLSSRNLDFSSATNNIGLFQGFRALNPANLGSCYVYNTAPTVVQISGYGNTTSGANQEWAFYLNYISA